MLSCIDSLVYFITHISNHFDSDQVLMQIIPKTRRIRLWHLLLTSCVIKSDLKKFQHISPNIVDLTGSISGEERGKSVATCQYTYLYAVNECSQRERQLEYFYPSPIKASIFKRGIDVNNWERTKNHYYLSLFSTFCSISASNNVISVLF